jgi:hypothetical protein
MNLAQNDADTHYVDFLGIEKGVPPRLPRER